MSFLGVPSFNSCFFKSSSFRAILCASFLFRRSFCIPGLLELLDSHVSNPGNHPVREVKKTVDRVGFPNDVNLRNRAGVQ